MLGTKAEVGHAYLTQLLTRLTIIFQDVVEIVARLAQLQAIYRTGRVYYGPTVVAITGHFLICFGRPLRSGELGRADALSSKLLSRTIVLCSRFARFEELSTHEKSGNELVKLD